jgi:hypothetical protein
MIASANSRCTTLSKHPGPIRARFEVSASWPIFLDRWFDQSRMERAAGARQHPLHALRGLHSFDQVGAEALDDDVGALGVVLRLHATRALSDPQRSISATR